jgi:hypothetical protein
MTTPAISIIFFIVAAFLGALGQFLYKSGADLAGSGLASYLFNWRLFAGPDLCIDVHLGRASGIPVPGDTHQARQRCRYGHAGHRHVPHGEVEPCRSILQSTARCSSATS